MKQILRGKTIQINKKIGYLTVISERVVHGVKGQRYSYHLCQCVCGSAPMLVRINSLIRDMTKSCGCKTKQMRREKLAVTNAKKKAKKELTK